MVFFNQCGEQLKKVFSNKFSSIKTVYHVVFLYAIPAAVTKAQLAISLLVFHKELGDIYRSGCVRINTDYTLKREIRLPVLFGWIIAISCVTLQLLF